MRHHERVLNWPKDVPRGANRPQARRTGSAEGSPARGPRRRVWLGGEAGASASGQSRSQELGGQGGGSRRLLGAVFISCGHGNSSSLTQCLKATLSHGPAGQTPKSEGLVGRFRGRARPDPCLFPFRGGGVARRLRPWPCIVAPFLPCFQGPKTPFHLQLRPSCLFLSETDPSDYISPSQDP